MTITNSLELYNNACREAGTYGNPGTGMADTYVLYGSNSSYVDRRAAYLEPYYIRIIEAMFFELVTGGSSSLLSLLCSRNGIQMDLENVRIDYKQMKEGQAGSYDIKPLLDGLNTAFSGDLSRCSTLYFGNHSKYVFQGMVFAKDFDHVAWIRKALEELDRQMGRVRGRQLQEDQETGQSDLQKSGLTENGSAEEKPDTGLTEISSAEKEPDISLTEISSAEEKPDTGPTKNNSTEKKPEDTLTGEAPGPAIFPERLEEIASSRRKADEETAERLAVLQKAVQEELGQIRQIREGVEYNYVLEAVLQLVELYMQLDDVLRYHPDTLNPESYTSLVETCHELRSNILQSLAFLDVTPVLRADVPYDPQFYQVTSGFRPARDSRVLKVLRPGFLFKGKVLQKALAVIS
ncbi:MAG: hypothetical protein E7239_08310 [Sarcina sp.]|nr:hypothetical protein [Sarcina sp.]